MATFRGMLINFNDDIEKHDPSICVSREPLSNVIDSIPHSAKHDSPSISSFRGMKINLNEHLEKNILGFTSAAMYFQPWSIPLYTKKRRIHQGYSHFEEDKRISYCRLPILQGLETSSFHRVRLGRFAETLDRCRLFSIHLLHFHEA
jgi:hypothetical protein